MQDKVGIKKKKGPTLMWTGARAETVEVTTTVSKRCDSGIVSIFGDISLPETSQHGAKRNDSCRIVTSGYQTRIPT